jgi:hypothetical protein
VPAAAAGDAAPLGRTNGSSRSLHSTRLPRSRLRSCDLVAPPVSPVVVERHPSSAGGGSHEAARIGQVLGSHQR